MSFKGAALLMSDYTDLWLTAMRSPYNWTRVSLLSAGRS